MTEIEKQLLIENNELRIRLAENKILIKALQNGETIPDIVSWGDCSVVTIISNIDDPYQIVVKDLKEGACTLSKKDIVTFSNQLFADIFSIPEDQVEGADFLMLIDNNDHSISELLQHARKKGKSGKIISFVNQSDVVRYFFITVTSIAHTTTEDLLVLFTDITGIKEHRVTSEKLLNNARLAALNIMEDEIAAKNELAEANTKLIEEISERKKAEESLLKVNRLYTVISLINQMIVRNQVRETIFTEACNIVIEHGKFQMAWIGLLDENKESIIPVTWAGADEGYLTIIKNITLKNTPRGNGPTGKAIRQGTYECCNDIANDHLMEPWRDEAIKRNYRASIALPISLFNKVIGAFTIYVSEPFFFNQTEIELLVHVTNDISFALEVTETEKKRQAAEKAIKKLNAELEQRVILRTHQLEHANKELEAFTYSVSHDLRAPLRNINGWGQVLLEECKEDLGENGIRYMDRVLSETTRMNNLIDDLLKLSRVTIAEKKRETVVLSKIAENIVQRLKEKTIQHNVEFIIQPGLVTIGDPRLLDIALTNLLDNAFKFTGKQIHARIEFGMSEVKGITTYWVKDNGVGFDMENAKNLFGVFQRMHNQNEFPGTGIGLATVQRIIHRHDGTIWAESEIDKGTTFYFTIPDVNIQDI